MEVLKKGRKPEDKEYEVECRNYRSLLRFKRSEAKHKFTPRNESFLVVECPECGNDVHREI